MNQPFLYDPQANVLRQRAEMQKPAIQGKFPGVVPEWDKYIEHIKSLPAYAPVSGWVPEVGKEYVPNTHFYVATDTDDDGLYNGAKVAVPIEQKQERPLCPECDGDGYVTNGEHPSSEDYRDYTCESCMGCGRVKEKDPPRVFTIQDMIECWEAAETYGGDDTYQSERGGKSVLPDKKQYFKIKFNLDIP